jgi:uncharacterized membrane protein YphA (DoxX/SURF4 family)
LAIGLSLVTGIWVHAASACGAVFMVTLMLAANYPGPQVEWWRYFGASLEHSVFLLCFLAFLVSDPAQDWSLRNRAPR